MLWGKIPSPQGVLTTVPTSVLFWQMWVADVFYHSPPAPDSQLAVLGWRGLRILAGQCCLGCSGDITTWLSWNDFSLKCWTGSSFWLLQPKLPSQPPLSQPPLLVTSIALKLLLLLLYIYRLNAASAFSNLQPPRTVHCFATVSSQLLGSNQ